MLTQKLLKELLHYDPETGIFTWKERSRKYFTSDWSFKTWNSMHSGKVTGNIAGKGYLQITILYISYLSHRLAWLYVYGEFPIDHTDHVNRVKHDNRIVNLRAVSCSDNLKNQKIRINNTSGCNGVHWIKSSKKWRGRISVNCKVIHLGVHEDWFEAVCARKSAERKYGFHENHGRP